MPSDMDVRPIMGSRFAINCPCCLPSQAQVYTRASGCRGKPILAKAGVASLCICITSLIVLLASGCNQKQQAVDLYVDAVMLKELDENEMAVEKLESAIKLNKSFSLAYSLLGEIYQEIKDYEKSAASYENATRLNPWSFKDYFNLGRVYQIMKKFAQAVKAYAKACELEPDHLEAHVGAAESYYEIEDYNNALAAAEQAEQIDPNVSEIQKRRLCFPLPPIAKNHL